jgi:hypothetical protein
MRALIRASLLLLSLCVPFSASAQRGGKAEALRIEIKRGATSVTVKDKIRSTEQAEYVFAARKGQRIKITLISDPAKSAVFDLSAADGVDYKFKYDGRTWSGRAPVTGDYFINVIRQEGASTTSAYALTLTIR